MTIGTIDATTVDMRVKGPDIRDVPIPDEGTPHRMESKSDTIADTIIDVCATYVTMDIRRTLSTHMPDQLKTPPRGSDRDIRACIPSRYLNMHARFHAFR